MSDPDTTRFVPRLTEGLLSTYKKINERYYESKKRRAAEAKARGTFDYRVKVNEVLNNRYRVLELIGKGSFGQVVRAEDQQSETKECVAIKIIKNKESFRLQARTEVEILRLLRKHDNSDQWCIVRLISEFTHEDHTCLVFELLSYTLYDLLRKTTFLGVSLNLIRKFARQILKTLAYLSLEEIKVIHCDLKPENVLFIHPHRSAVKVVDFGSSCRASHTMYTYIQSRFYRSPEVILSMPYGMPIDMWSLGCILVEMHTGVPLFGGRDQHDQMRRFVALKGNPPRPMMERGRKTSQFFETKATEVSETPADGSHDVTMTHDSDSSDLSDSDGYSDSGETSDVSMPAAGAAVGAPARAVRAREHRRRRAAVAAAQAAGGSSPTVVRPVAKPAPRTVQPEPATSFQLLPYTGQSRSSTVHTNLSQVLGVNNGGPGGRRRSETAGHTRRHYALFMDLVSRMLEYDPAKRIKPMEALNHPFLRDEQLYASSNSGTSTSTTATSAADSAPATAPAAGSAGTVPVGTTVPTLATTAVTAVAPAPVTARAAASPPQPPPAKPGDVPADAAPVAPAPAASGPSAAVPAAGAAGLAASPAGALPSAASTVAGATATATPPVTATAGTFPYSGALFPPGAAGVAPYANMYPRYVYAGAVPAAGQPTADDMAAAAAAAAAVAGAAMPEGMAPHGYPAPPMGRSLSGSDLAAGGFPPYVPGAAGQPWPAGPFMQQPSGYYMQPQYLYFPPPAAHGHLGPMNPAMPSMPLSHPDRYDAWAHMRAMPLPLNEFPGSAAGTSGAATSTDTTDAAHAAVSGDAAIAATAPASKEGPSDA